GHARGQEDPQGDGRAAQDLRPGAGADLPHQAVRASVASSVSFTESPHRVRDVAGRGFSSPCPPAPSYGTGLSSDVTDLSKKSTRAGFRSYPQEDTVGDAPVDECGEVGRCRVVHSYPQVIPRIGRASWRESV